MCRNNLDPSGTMQGPMRTPTVQFERFTPHRFALERQRGFLNRLWTRCWKGTHKQTCTGCMSCSPLLDHLVDLALCRSAALARQGDDELREPARHSVDVDGAPVLLHDDVVAQRQPEPRPLPGRLGGEERVEHL